MGRRALRAARPRVVELRDGEACAPRPAARPLPPSIASRASSATSGPPTSTTASSRASRSTSCSTASVPDGHFASLYPNEPTLRIRDRRAIAAEAKLEPFVDRVTMTLELLNSAPLVVFLVTGADKADAVTPGRSRTPPSEAIPASLARSTTGRTDRDPRSSSRGEARDLDTERRFLYVIPHGPRPRTRLEPRSASSRSTSPSS